jgi:hypothetical protein
MFQKSRNGMNLKTSKCIKQSETKGEYDQTMWMQPHECKQVNSTKWMQPSECIQVNAFKWMHSSECIQVTATK